MIKFLSSLVDESRKTIKKLQPTVKAINDFESQMKKLTDAELKNMTNVFKDRLNAGETLNDILPEAFAVVREASVRVFGMRHYDVQMIGGIILHQGRIAEMKTGEGKTLVATLPVYLNALSGHGVHVITVNDYLATRDSQWMGQLYTFLGLSVGLIVHDIEPRERKIQYACDIVYGTNNEFGFDYLRDNMAINQERMVQRELNFAIVDEVDSILIDEARTPLIISGEADKPVDLYHIVARIVPNLKREVDYTVEEKQRIAVLTEEGQERVEKILGIDDLNEAYEGQLAHHFNQGLVAAAIMKEDVDYIVKDGEIIIVDSHTGRLMYGRRFSNGLHQAIEAKEKVEVKKESQTLATITFQNYFRMYTKLSGMTGTAKTEEEEFRAIYAMDVIEIPTNMEVQREDLPDIIFKTEQGKFEAIADLVEGCHKKGQPVLVGTIGIDKSESLSALFKKRGIKHQVLNAKYHEQEAEIVSKAGEKFSVTIATNMAGRGTDIVLGEGVQELGGLYVIGSERHDSRRIDNQLRGRSGRQGDPGTSRFYISGEDNLMRIYGGDRMKSLISMTVDDDAPIDSKILSSGIERAQKALEKRNFQSRKTVLEYDDVMNKQREIIYAQRRDVLTSESVKDSAISMIEDVIADTIYQVRNGSDLVEDWDLKGLALLARQSFAPSKALNEDSFQGMDSEDINIFLKDTALRIYEGKEEEIGSETMRELEKHVMLNVVDQEWMAHIDNMDELRQAVGLRAYGQKNPLTEYKTDSFVMYQEMVNSIKEQFVSLIYRAKVVKTHEEARNIKENRSEDEVKTPKKSDKIGRNDPCPCGSGEKYKKCCGK